LLRNFTELVGGPLGRRTSPGTINPGTFTLERVLVLLTTAMAALAILIKNPCRTDGWVSPDQYYMACHSQWPEAFARVSEGIPFLQLGYPAITGAFAAVTAELVPAGSTLRYYDLHSVLAVVAWLVTVYATVRMTNRRPWDAAMVAVAPMIVLAGFIGWDLWAVMSAALGMLAFARSSFVPAGIFLGLGTAAAGYPLLIFGAIALLMVRTRHFSGPVVTGAALAATWLVVNIPFALDDPRSWLAQITDALTREAGHSSVWFAYNTLTARAGGWEMEAVTTSVLAAVAFTLMGAGISALALFAPRRPRLAQLTLLLVGALILTGREYSPQHAIWLVPLVALAYPKWRAFTTWQLLEAAHFWALMIYLGREGSGGAAQNNIDTPYYLVAVCGHMLATAYIMYRVAEGILEPGQDPVRRLDVDDPQGGPFDNAVDHRRQGRRHRSQIRTRVPLNRPAPELKDHP